ncbi:Phospholipid phosphatase 4-like [Homarus americanus]|uniref:Phospholipid phosphatase 4-like n=1 Tax=Homarus americanus TaxID=6706 RepID=A0A8J5TM44_HOMAM|nr:Phospholipid phosphatase 4-like [Homarus americanus]
MLHLKFLILTKKLIPYRELEQTPPFVRKIHIDELWLYKNPRTPSYVPTSILWPLVFIVPTSVMLLYFLVKRDRTELCQGLFALSLALGLNGVITNIIKLIVGMKTIPGVPQLVDLRKTECFQQEAWARLEACGRHGSYHIGFNDVLVGSVLGLFISYLCYRQYYPRLTSPHCHLPYLMVPTVIQPKCANGIPMKEFPKFLDPESPIEEQVKWM